MMIKRLILIFSLSISMVILLNYNDAISKEKNNEITMIPASFADLAERLSGAVVNISTTQKMIIPRDFPEIPQFPEGSPFEDFFEEFMDLRGMNIPRRPISSLGSGFIIDAKKGYIVTNNHVIRDAENIQVTLANDITVDARIIGTDEKTDIAVLQIETKGLDLIEVSFGDSDRMRVGDWTLAIGNPFGLGGSVTAGIISARARDINSGPYDDYLQTDASINRGNSGGPLFNMKGEVIGINTAIFSPTGGSVGISFAIPSALAKPVISQIIKYGRTKRGWLGVRIQHVTKEIAESFGLDTARGALVASVNENGPAKIAGLKAGDIILEINGRQIKEMKYLPRIVAENEIGAKVEIKYWRNNKIHTTKAIIGELEKAEEEGLLYNTSRSTNGSIYIDQIGVKLIDLNNELRDQYNISQNIEGVLVIEVDPVSDAANKGIYEGVVIMEINQQPISSPKDVLDIVDKAQKSGRKSILLLVNDSGNARFIALKLASQ